MTHADYADGGQREGEVAEPRALEEPRPTVPRNSFREPFDGS